MVDSVNPGGITSNPGLVNQPNLQPEVAPSQEVSQSYNPENTVATVGNAQDAPVNVGVSLDSPDPAPVANQNILQKAFEAKLDGFRAAVHEFNLRFNAEDIDISDGQSLLLMIRGMLSDTQALISAESIDQVFGYRAVEQLRRESGADEALALRTDINDRSLEIDEKNQDVAEHSQTLSEKSASKGLREQQLAAAQEQSQLQGEVLALGQEIEVHNNRLTEQSAALLQKQAEVQETEAELSAAMAATTAENDNSAEITSLQQTVDSLRTEYSNLHSSLMATTTELAQKEGARLQKMQQLSETQSDYTPSQEDAAELEPLQRGIAQLQTEIEEIESLSLARTLELSQKQTDKLQKQQELAELQAVHSAGESDTPNAPSEADGDDRVELSPEGSLEPGLEPGSEVDQPGTDNREQIARLQQEIMQLNSDITSIQGELQGYKDQLDQKQTEKLQMKQQLSEVVVEQLQGDITQLGAEIAEVEREVATLQQQIQQLESENAADSTTLNAVQRVLDSVTEEFVSLNNLLGRIKQRFDPAALQTGEEGVEAVKELERMVSDEVARESGKLRDMKDVLKTQSEEIVAAQDIRQEETLDTEIPAIVSASTVVSPAQVEARTAVDTAPDSESLLAGGELDTLAAVFIPRDTTILEQLIAALEKEESRRDDELPVPDEGIAVVLQSIVGGNELLREEELDPAAGPVLGDSLSFEGADNPQVFARLMLEGRIQEGMENALAGERQLKQGQESSQNFQQREQRVAKVLQELPEVLDVLAESQKDLLNFETRFRKSQFG